MKDLTMVPQHVQTKFQEWVVSVETAGLEETRKRPGWHDEPLKGDKAGTRSVRLSQAYRAYYTATASGDVRVVLVRGVDKHLYRIGRK
jgi:proteic killer suppression protein